MAVVPEEKDEKERTLFDIINKKLVDTKRQVFVSRITLCAKIVDRQATNDSSLASFLANPHPLYCLYKSIVYRLFS